MSQQLANGLAGRVPKLLVTLSDHPDGPALSIDGHDSAVGAELPIDLGPHEIAVTAPGFTPWHETFTVQHEAIVSNIVVQLVPIATTTTTPAPRPTPKLDDHATHDSRRLYGQVAVIGGGALVAGGLIAGGLAYSQWQHAQSCTGCDRSAQSHSAIIRGDVSTGFVVAGLAVAVVGVYLWKTSSTRAELTAGPGTIAVRGSF